MSAVVSFLAVYLAGVVFLALILKMAKKSSDPNSFSDISEGEMKKTVSATKLTKEDLDAAKAAYDANK